MLHRLRSPSVTGYIQYHWPQFFGLYSGLVLAVLIIGLGLALKWYSLIPFAIAISLIALYLLTTSLWVVRKLYGDPEETPAKLLVTMSQLQPEEKVGCIDLGIRETPRFIAQFLTIGEIVVIDVFNPQSNPGSALRRARNHSQRPSFDPRINWVDGSVDLLPLSNHTVSAMYLNEVLSEYWLPGERERLLAEVWRVLIPEGRLLIAERVRTQTNLFYTGLQTSSWSTISDWRSLLATTDFIIQREEVRHGLMYFVRAKKPSPTSGKQMKLGLEYA
jgi:SAM-dependent methyltransferase